MTTANADKSGTFKIGGDLPVHRLGFGAMRVTILQLTTPRHMLGRVMSSLMSLMAMSQVFAMFVAGPVAQKAGIRNLYFASAAILLGIGVLGLGRLRLFAIRAS